MVGCNKDEQEECVEHVKARLEAYGIPSPSVDADELVRRRRIAVGVIVTMAVTLAIAQLGNGQPVGVVVVRLGYMLVELPLLFVAVAHAYDYSLLRRYTPLKSLALSAAVAMGVAVGTISLAWLLATVFPVIAGAFHPVNKSYFAAAAAGAFLGLMHLGIFALAVVYPFAAHDARVRALETEKLRTAAELARLRGHLEPHFLLNTLNAIAGLVTEDPREARRLLAALGDLLRDALREGDEMQTLEQEEAWLRRYAEILESRHRGALSFRWDIDPAVRTARVPRLLLQPLVENAIKHGALRRRGGGVVTVRAGRVGDSVECVVEDDGPGFSQGPIRQGAVGLSVVRRRVELKFERAAFRIESSTEGTRAIVAFEPPHASELAAPSGAMPTAPQRA